jgi:hypothetical protein
MANFIKKKIFVKNNFAGRTLIVSILKYKFNRERESF